MSHFKDMSWEKTVVALIELGMGGEVRWKSGDGNDDGGGYGDDDDDDIYILWWSVFWAERRRREVSRPLGLAGGMPA